MTIDAELLKKMKPNDPPTLHLYEWEGEAATYGYFLDPKKFLDLEKVEALGLSLARRPTGGGIIFHVSDLAFSVLVPANFPHYSTNTLDNYDFINSAVKRGVKTLLHRFLGSILDETQPSPSSSELFSSPIMPSAIESSNRSKSKAQSPFSSEVHPKNIYNSFEHNKSLTLLQEEPIPLDESCCHFCMAKPTKYDVMLEGWKIAGAAQRRRKQGYLHQGSIAIALPKENFLNQVLLKGTQVHEAMLAHTFSLLGKDWTQNDLEEVRRTLKRQLQEELTR